MNEIIIILILILLNGILSMSEIALISVRKTFLANEIKQGSKSAKTALKLAEEPDKFLSTVQIGITIIGILTGLYSGSVLADDFAAVLVNWGVGEGFADEIAQTLIVVVVTYLTLIFGELLPKRIGMSKANSAAKIVGGPMYWLSAIASPFVWILSKSTSGLFNLLGIKEDNAKVTEEEIKSMIEEGTKDGEVQEVEQDIVERVFMLGDLRISSIMTHRSEIIALDINMSVEELKQTLVEDLHESYPVIDKTLDDIKGLVTLKNLMFKVYEEGFKLEDVIEPATYFHENMSVYKALEEIKEKRINRALICDEFGSCQGIITLRDILEGLVGNIDDVDDIDEQPDIIKRTSGEGYLVDGQCQIYDFLSYFEREDLYTQENYNTVAGLILEELEHIPEAGETVEWEGFKFEIMDMDGVRIDKILVTTPEETAKSEESAI